MISGTTALRVVRLRRKERPPIRRVAANISNNQSRTATRGGLPAWGLGKVMTTPHRKNWSSHWHTEVPRTWTDNLAERKRNLMAHGDAREEK